MVVGEDEANDGEAPGAVLGGGGDSEHVDDGGHGDGGGGLMRGRKSAVRGGRMR